VSGNFAILNPCAKKWSDLAGAGRARYCTDCKTQVHDLSAYTPDEWRELWTLNDGHVCGLLCGESPTPQRSRRAILVGALLTAVAPLWGQVGGVRMRVIDRTGAVIAGAEVSLLGANNQPIRTSSTDASGEVIWTGLSLGDNRVLVTATGFSRRTVTVTIHVGNEQKVGSPLEIALDVGYMGGAVTVSVPGTVDAPEPEPTPVTLSLDLPQQAVRYPVPLTSDVAPPAPPPKPPKRKWWRIF
jgi:Carboxypeptidase regulatory-like domain